MNKKLLLTFGTALLMTSTLLRSQTEQIIKCGTPELPQDFEEWLAPLIQARLADPSTAAVAYNIPTIVHVINNGEAIGTGQNISTAQINSQFDVLNEDFKKLNADWTSTPSWWTSLVANCTLTFCKALRTPAGNALATPGYERINRNTLTTTAPPYTMAQFTSLIKPGSIWDPTKYCNIWVTSLSGGVIGYATFPANSTLTGLSGPYGTTTTDGVVIHYTCFGRVGNLDPNYNKGRTLTHELGHWLGLRHINGDGNCATDYVADTPAQEALHFGCISTYPYHTTQCSGNTTNGEMCMNYMDYTDDQCMFMFTNGQNTRIQTCMANGTYRVGLNTSNGCIAVSINDIDNSNRFDLFPNPTTGLLTIKPLDDAMGTTVKIYNTIGEVIYEIKVDVSGDIKIDLSTYGNGVYFVELSNEAGMSTQKVTLTK